MAYQHHQNEYICIDVYVHLYFLTCTCALQVNANLAHEAAQMPTSQGCLLATGTVERIQEVYLVLENKILTTIGKKTEAVPALFVAFFVFHINFTVGAVSLFQFLEFLFLKSKVPKKPRFIAKLKL